MLSRTLGLQMLGLMQFTVSQLQNKLHFQAFQELFIIVK